MGLDDKHVVPKEWNLRTRLCSKKMENKNKTFVTKRLELYTRLYFQETGEQKFSSFLQNYNFRTRLNSKDFQTRE